MWNSATRRRRLAVVAAVSGLGIAVLAGSANLVAARSDDCPTSTDIAGTTPDDTDMDMNQEMTDEGSMDMDHEMLGGGNMGHMHHEMMVAMHDAMMGRGSMGRAMENIDGEMMGGSEDADGVAGC